MMLQVPCTILLKTVGLQVTGLQEKYSILQGGKKARRQTYYLSRAVAHSPVNLGHVLKDVTLQAINHSLIISRHLENLWHLLLSRSTKFKIESENSESTRMLKLNATS